MVRFPARCEYLRTGRIQGMILLVSIFNIFFHRASGQTAELISRILVIEGFENTGCIISGDKCWVSIENHTYRWDIKAISKALDIISSTLHDPLEINLVILENKLPQVLFTIDRDDWLSYSREKSGPDELQEKLTVTSCTKEAALKFRDVKAENPSAGKFDLVVYPQLFFENTLTYKFYETQVNIAPALQFSLWKGSRFTGQVIFPLYNELGQEGDNIRPGIVAISQDVRFTGHFTGSIAAGNFTGGTYGFAADLQLLLFRERFILEMKSGLTGSSFFLDNGWIHSNINNYTGSLSAAWFWQKYNMELKTGGAKYVNGDYGLFASCLRRFREVSVGFYLQTGEYSNNGGFFFSVPLPGQKRANRRFFRISLPPQYEFTYNAGTEYFYGQTFKTGPDPLYSDRFRWPGSLKRMLINN